MTSTKKISKRLCKECKYFTTFNSPEWPGLCEYPVPYWMEEAGADPLITGELRADLCNTFEAAEAIKIPQITSSSSVIRKSAKNLKVRL